MSGFWNDIYHSNRNKTKTEIATREGNVDEVDLTMLLCFGLCISGERWKIWELWARKSIDCCDINGLFCGELANNYTKEDADNGGLAYNFQRNEKILWRPFVWCFGLRICLLVIWGEELG